MNEQQTFNKIQVEQSMLKDHYLFDKQVYEGILSLPVEVMPEIDRQTVRKKLNTVNSLIEKTEKELTALEGYLSFLQRQEVA